MIFHSEEARRCSFTIAELKIMWGKCHPCTELKEVNKRGPLEAPWLHHVAIKPVISSAPLQLHVLNSIRESSNKQTGGLNSSTIGIIGSVRILQYSKTTQVVLLPNTGEWLAQAGTSLQGNKTFRQVKEKHWGSKQINNVKQRNIHILHHPPLATPGNLKQLFSVKRELSRFNHLRSVWGSPVGPCWQYVALAPYCSRDWWPAGRMAAHVSWWEQLEGHCGAASIGLQNTATESGGLPKHYLINNFGHTCFQKLNFHIKHVVWQFVSLKSSRPNYHKKCYSRYINFSVLGILLPYHTYHPKASTSR